MALAAGTAIGHYEILSALGAGGMGEVYRARDGKLNRDVAIKVLPPLFTADPDRLARFRREAQVLAALNHPNIGHIYGLEDSGPTHALVLELVEGPTLADRIAQGRVALDEAIPIARQIADALEAAHEQGIIHRDLKPANIKVRPDGTVKVLDFGLAKALEGTSDSSGSGSGVMNSPTLTARGTQLGVIVGTAAYMAPEQARGRAVDRRADIWAFGVIVYEMLTGARAFEGDDISVTLASVLKEDPKWDLLPADLPLSLQRLLRRCFEKDPKRRLSAIADARLDLDESTGPYVRPFPSQPVPTTAARRLAFWTPWVLAGTASVAALLLWAPWKPLPVPPPTRISADLGLEGLLALSVGPAAVISPDGRTAVFVVQRSGRTALFVRQLDQLHSTFLAGTEDGIAPFFSPDNRWIGFFAGGKLKKIAVTGGAAVTLCDAISGRGGWWTEDGQIIFQPTAAAGAVLQRVSAAGGTATPLLKESLGGASQRWPQVLPGERALLYSVNAGANWDDADIVVQPLPQGEAKVLVRRGFHGRYVDGHLLYISQGTLFAVRFDLRRLELTGTPAPVVEGISTAIATGGAQFSISDNGTLLYVPGATPTLEMPVSWMDETGKTGVLRGDTADWWTPAFSPDGKRLAMTIGGGAAADIWIYDWPRNALTKFTFGGGADSAPVWTPDGARIAYTSTAEGSGSGNIFWKRSDGSGEAQRLTEGPSNQVPHSFHPSGKYLAFTDRRPETGMDVLILPLEGDEKSGWKPGKPAPFLNSPAAEAMPAFSPDGRWLAYMSTESAIPEIFVRPFGNTDGKWKVSDGAALYPTWSRARRELLYFASGQNVIMTVGYETEGSSLRHERPRQWSPAAVQPMRTSRPFDIHPDGNRLAVRKPPDTPQRQDSPVFVFNFPAELERLAARK